jgi:hypothetical protein
MFSINIGKTDRALSVDESKFTPAVMEYIVRYGLTQALNDAHSQITSKSDPDEKDRADKAWNLANKKLDALYAGELRAERVGKPRDPVMAEAMVLAKAFLVAQEVRKGADEATARKRVEKLDRAKVADWSRGYLERNPEVVEKARAIVAARAESVADEGDSVDLDALMADPAE